MGCSAALLSVGHRMNVLGVLLGGPAGFPGVLCSVLQENMTCCRMSPPPAMGWVLSLELHQFHTNPKYSDCLCCFKGLLFPDKWLSQACFSFPSKTLGSAACPSCAQATNSDKEQPIGTGMQGPAGWTVFIGLEILAAWNYEDLLLV